MKALRPSEGSLRRQLNAIKEIEYPWMSNVPKGVPQQAIKNLGKAFVGMWEGRAGYPKFKSSGKTRESARLDNGPGTFRFGGPDKGEGPCKSVRVPVFGWIETFEKPRWQARALFCTLRFEGERWFLSVVFEVPVAPPVHAITRGKSQASSVGIDLGLTSAITLSTGEKFEAPKPLRRALAKLARLQRSHARKEAGSANREKSRRKVSRLHWRIAQIRSDWQHQVTTGLARRFDIVFMEDLNVKGMAKNHCLALSIMDIGWGEIGRQLGYKTEVIKVGRFFPSSKKCSTPGCNHVTDALPLKVREWTCPECNVTHDRDVNAAKKHRDRRSQAERPNERTRYGELRRNKRLWR